MYVKSSPEVLCEGCGGKVWAHGVRQVELVDMAVFARSVRLVWHKRRWRCPNSGCSVTAFTEQDPSIAPARALMTTRAGKWATQCCGRGSAVSTIARTLVVDWRCVNSAVMFWGNALLQWCGALLRADPGRMGRVEALVWMRYCFVVKAGISIVGGGLVLWMSSLGSYLMLWRVEQLLRLFGGCNNNPIGG